MAIFFRKTAPPFEAAVHWVFAEDIDATYNELKSAGANIVDPLEKKPWGLRQFTVEDIDGNRFYFTTTNQAPGNFGEGRRSHAPRAGPSPRVPNVHGNSTEVTRYSRQSAGMSR